MTNHETDPTEIDRLHAEILEGRAQISELRGLLRSENQRANAAIGRETTAEQAAIEAQEDGRRLRAVVARIAQMADAWEQRLPEVIRTPAVVSAIRAALEAAVSVPPPAPRADAEPDDGEGDELVCVDECGFCNACGYEPFGTPAEGWREAARFLRRTARDSGDRQGALHGARLIEAELRRLADEARGAAEYSRALATPPSAEAAAYIRERLADEVGDDHSCAESGCSGEPGPCVAGEQQNETPEAAPCDVPNGCEDGDLCATHEEQQAHAEGEHAFCGVTCEVAMPTELMRNSLIAWAPPGGKGILAELERRAAAATAVVAQPGKEN